MTRIPITVADANRCWPRYANKLKVSSTGCILWQGATNECGRGVIRINSALSMVQAHRLAWVYYTQQEIPDTLDVLHTCDTGNCVNKQHLYLGTHQDNMNDRDKRRRSCGGLHLSEATRNEIRELRAIGWKYAALQAKFNVSHTTILRTLKK